MEHLWWMLLYFHKTLMFDWVLSKPLIYLERNIEMISRTFFKKVENIFLSSMQRFYLVTSVLFQKFSNTHFRPSVVILFPKAL